MRDHGGDLLPSFCHSKATFKWNEVRSSTFLSCFHSTRNEELNFLQSPFETTYKAATFERASAATAAATAITAPRWRSQFSTKPGRNSKQQETERKKASACDSQWISSLTGTQSRGKWVLKSFLTFMSCRLYVVTLMISGCHNHWNYHGRVPALLDAIFHH